MLENIFYNLNHDNDIINNNKIIVVNKSLLSLKIKYFQQTCKLTMIKRWRNRIKLCYINLVTSNSKFKKTECICTQDGVIHHSFVLKLTLFKQCSLSKNSDNNNSNMLFRKKQHIVRELNLKVRKPSRWRSLCPLLN